MKKIVFICPFDLNWKRGTPVRARNTIKAVSRKFDVIVISFGEFEKNNINLSTYIKFDIPILRTFIYWILVFLVLFKENPQIVHGFTTTSILPALFYKVLNRKAYIVYEMHGVAKYELLYHNTLKRAFYSFLDKINLKFANKIIVMSYPMKKYLVEEGIKGDRIHVIWGPVDTQKYKYKKLKPSEFYLVGYGGGSQFWSGFGTIIEASKKIDNPNIKFIIVGGLPKDVSNKRFTNVEFMGKLDEAKYFEILSNCNVLLSVRVGDRVAELQYPQKLSAYLAMGRPIIASDVNDQRYILERAKCGVVIKPDDPDELIRAILHLYQIQNSQPELIEEMGIMGRKFAEENLSFEVFAKKLREVYQLNRENSW